MRVCLNVHLFFKSNFCLAGTWLALLFPYLIFCIVFANSSFLLILSYPKHLQFTRDRINNKMQFKIMKSCSALAMKKGFIGFDLLFRFDFSAECQVSDGVVFMEFIRKEIWWYTICNQKFDNAKKNSELYNRVEPIC